MTGRLLDMTDMPTERVYTCKDGSEINLREVLEEHRDGVQSLASSGLIKPNESFGFAMTVPAMDLGPAPNGLWDKPEEFVWFVGGWGPKRERYAANAVRKLRPLLRTGYGSTLEMRFFAKGLFTDKVESEGAAGQYPWGDFPWGGAVEAVYGDLFLTGAVSCLTEIEDDTITRLILGCIAQRIIKGDGLLSDD